MPYAMNIFLYSAALLIVTKPCKCDTECDCDCDKFMQYDFGQFEYIQLCISRVQFVEDDWKQSQSNCWYFLKNYLCRHFLFVTVVKKKIKVPLAYRGVQIDKPRRGRISKAMKAFEVQDNIQKNGQIKRRKQKSQINYKHFFLKKFLKIGKISINNYFCLL